MLEVRLLGQFDVRLDGEPIAIASRPAQSLLAYLLLSAGTTHRREQLAGLLWPDTSETNARTSLRHALWHVRKALGANQPAGLEILLVDDISIAFNAGADYWLDVSVLDEKVTGEGSLDALIGAASVYKGDLLPGFYDEWVTLERERLQAVFEHKMKRLCDRLAEAQRWEDVLEWGERWIALGQTPEPAYRALMIAHSKQGDRSKVASVFERCVQAMHNELGVEPSEETRALYERLSKGEAIPEELERLGRLRRFLSPQLAELIVSSGDESLLKSHRREIVVVFCDLRGFTAFTETTEPEEVMGIIHEYHRDMGTLIHQFQGTIERFAGDGLMILFNDPLPCPDPAARAVRMATAMRQRMDELTAAWQKRGHELGFGVGIALGYATLGQIGFEGRYDYGAVGTVVNLASRLCAGAQAGQILISQRVCTAVEDLAETESIGELTLKGLHKPMTVFNVLRLKAME